jgi:HK97 family phage major capsid protein
VGRLLRGTCQLERAIVHFALEGAHPVASNTDAILAKYVAEIEDRQQLIDGVLDSANGDDLSDEKMELITRAKERMTFLNNQMAPLEEARRISAESSERIASIARYMTGKPAEQQPVEYRSAGEYLIDRWRAGLGQQEAVNRLDQYHRAAAHQTTGDNAGLIPSPIVQPVVNFVDSNRPLVSWLGPRQLPGQNWSRPKVTQHTSIAAQGTEKTELVSQKMLITKLAATAVTYGGYVNVSRQDIDFTQPGIMDIVIGDLAGQYAIQTEAAAFTTFDAAATAGLTLPTGTNTGDQLAASLWDAASRIYTATRGQGRLAAFMPPAMLAAIGPVFPPIPASPSQSPGLSASDFGTGLVGNISGIPIYVSPGVGASRILVVSSAGAEAYEDRIGSLQVVEPSVLGIQVAYAGYFTPLVIEATSIIKITKTP